MKFILRKKCKNKLLSKNLSFFVVFTVTRQRDHKPENFTSFDAKFSKNFRFSACNSRNNENFKKRFAHFPVRFPNFLASRSLAIGNRPLLPEKMFAEKKKKTIHSSLLSESNKKKKKDVTGGDAPVAAETDFARESQKTR